MECAPRYGHCCHTRKTIVKVAGKWVPGPFLPPKSCVLWIHIKRGFWVQNCKIQMQFLPLFLFILIVKEHGLEASNTWYITCICISLSILPFSTSSIHLFYSLKNKDLGSFMENATPLRDRLLELGGG